MLDNEHLHSGNSLVYHRAGMYVPQQVSYLSVTDSQESPMNKHMAIASLALEELHSDSSNSLPSGNRSSRRLREFIPEHKKDNDYWMKRQKNNEAAKRSREKRRLNDVIMGQRIMELTNENKRLRMELDAIRRAFGSPPPPQPPPPPLSVDMPYNADISYCTGGNANQKRRSLPSIGSIAVSTPNAITSLSCSSFARMPVEPSRMPSSCDLQSFRETLPGDLGKPLSFDERQDLIRSSSGPNRTTCMLYPFEHERLRQKQMEAAIPVGSGSDGSRTLSLANPTSHTSSPKDCVVALPGLDNLSCHAWAADNQVNSSMPMLVRHVDCFRTTLSESHLDTGMRQGNTISGQGILHSQASRKHRVELPLLFSDVSSSDEDGDDILGDLYRLRSSEERPLNLSTRSGSSPVKDGQALPVSHRNTGFISDDQGTAAVQPRTMPVLENLEQMTSAFNLPTSLSRLNYSRNVLNSLSKFELQSPKVPHLSSSFLLPSNDEVQEKKGLPEMLTREVLSTTSLADSFLEGSSCLLKFPYGASQQNLDAPVHEICDEEETRFVAVLGEQVISDTELYTFLQSDLVETPMKAGKDTGQVLSRPVRGGVPLKLWHKWSSAFSEKLKVAMEGREYVPCDADGPIHFQQ